MLKPECSLAKVYLHTRVLPSTHSLRSGQALRKAWRRQPRAAPLFVKIKPTFPSIPLVLHGSRRLGQMDGAKRCLRQLKLFVFDSPFRCLWVSKRAGISPLFLLRQLGQIGFSDQLVKFLESLHRAVHASPVSIDRPKFRIGNFGRHAQKLDKVLFVELSASIVHVIE